MSRDPAEREGWQQERGAAPGPQAGGDRLQLGSRGGGRLRGGRAGVGRLALLEELAEPLLLKLQVGAWVGGGRCLQQRGSLRVSGRGGDFLGLGGTCSRLIVRSATLFFSAISSSSPAGPAASPPSAIGGVGRRVAATSESWRLLGLHLMDALCWPQKGNVAPGCRHVRRAVAPHPILTRPLARRRLKKRGWRTR